jgi:hypothetical protein
MRTFARLDENDVVKAVKNVHDDFSAPNHMRVDNLGFGREILHKRWNGSTFINDPAFPPPDIKPTELKQAENALITKLRNAAIIGPGVTVLNRNKWKEIAAAVRAMAPAAEESAMQKLNRYKWEIEVLGGRLIDVVWNDDV